MRPHVQTVQRSANYQQRPVTIHHIFSRIRLFKTIPVSCHIEFHSPAHSTLPQDIRLQLQLKTLVGNFHRIFHLRTERIQTARNRNIINQRTGIFVIVIQFHIQTIIEHIHVQTQVILLCLFPGKIRRYRLVSRYTRLPEEVLVHNVHQSVSEVSTCECLSGFSITTANLTPVQPTSGQAFDERFLRKRPAYSHRREICPAISLSERRTTVTTERKLQQITLFVIISQAAEIAHHPLLGEIRSVITCRCIFRILWCSVIHHRRHLLRVIIIHIITHSPQSIAVHRKCLFLVCIDTQ